MLSLRIPTELPKNDNSNDMASFVRILKYFFEEDSALSSILKIKKPIGPKLLIARLHDWQVNNFTKNQFQCRIQKN